MWGIEKRCESRVSPPTPPQRPKSREPLRRTKPGCWNVPPTLGPCQGQGAKPPQEAPLQPFNSNTPPERAPPSRRLAKASSRSRSFSRPMAIHAVSPGKPAGSMVMVCSAGEWGEFTPVLYHEGAGGESTEIGAFRSTLRLAGIRTGNGKGTGRETGTLDDRNRENAEKGAGRSGKGRGNQGGLQAPFLISDPARRQAIINHKPGIRNQEPVTRNYHPEKATGRQFFPPGSGSRFRRSGG